MVGAERDPGTGGGTLGGGLVAVGCGGGRAGRDGIGWGGFFAGMLGGRLDGAILRPTSKYGI